MPSNREVVKQFIYWYVGAFDGLLCHIILPIICMIWPKIFEHILGRPIDSATEFGIRLFMGMCLALGLTQCCAIVTKQRYEILKFCGASTCLLNFMVAVLFFVGMFTFGWQMALVTLLYIALMVPKLVLFVVGLADECYEHEHGHEIGETVVLIDEDGSDNLDKQNGVKWFVFGYHGVFEGGISAIAVGIIGLVWPDMYASLIGHPLGDTAKFAIRLFSITNIVLGIMLVYSIYVGNFKRQYYILKYYGSFLCIADLLFSSVCVAYINVFGYAMLYPAGTDFAVMVPKIVLFVCSVADKFYVGIKRRVCTWLFG